jgi:hypothetical protein
LADQLIREATSFQSNPLSPVPQYWNVSTSAYEKLQGSGGAANMNLPSGAATEATLALIASYVDGIETLLGTLGTQTTLTALLAKFGSLGQKAMSGSAPVVLASDQAAIPITRNGVARTMTHTIGTAGVATGTALASNTNRKYALIVNDSANVVYIKLGATAALNTGIRLNANGGSYEINETNLYTGVIDCISTVAVQTLLVTEGV